MRFRVLNGNNRPSWIPTRLTEPGFWIGQIPAAVYYYTDCRIV